MKTEKELNAKILALTLLINEKHKELSKFLSELPISTPDEKNPAITIRNLEDYYETLKVLLKKYEMEHKPLNDK